MGRSFDVGKVHHDTGVFLSHTNETEVLRLLVQGEKADKGVALEEDEGAPCLEEGKEPGRRQATLEGSVASTGGGSEEVAWEEGVLL